MNQLQTWLASSQDPTKVSATVSGIILGASSLITYLAMQFLHISLSAGDLGSLATGIGMIAGAIAFIFGLIRKGTVKLGTVK